MEKYIYRIPILLPMMSMALNVVIVCSGFLFEGRLRTGSITYFFLYASTLKSARKGDLLPYYRVLSGGML